MLGMNFPLIYFNYMKEGLFLHFVSAKTPGCLILKVKGLSWETNPLQNVNAFY